MGPRPRVATTNVVLVANAFIWYFLAYRILQQLIGKLPVTDTETLAVLGINVACIAVTAIIGSLLADKLSRRKLLSWWMFSGVFVSLMLFFYVPSTVVDLIIVSAIFGGYFGLGMPSVMGHFAQSTIYANRARLGGIIFLVISLGFFLIGSLVVSDITLASVALTIVQILSLSVFVKLKTNIAIAHETQKTTYTSVLSNRSLLLFLIPWFVFNIVNYMTIPVVSKLSQEYEIMTSLNLLENIIIAIVALVTGFLADSIGRKRLAIFGFASFGVGYAVLGLIQDSVRWPIHIVADGLAWGTLYVLFLFTLWGDLSQGQRGEKFYVMGALPFLFSNFMTPFLGTLTADIHPGTLFSFASFFLFLAVLPLFYAPETLPEKVIKDRDLQSYVEKAKQKAQKESEKDQKKQPGKTENEQENEAPEESPEDEEARKLAEKYY